MKLGSVFWALIHPFEDAWAASREVCAASWINVSSRMPSFSYTADWPIWISRLLLPPPKGWVPKWIQEVSTSLRNTDGSWPITSAYFKAWISASVTFFISGLICILLKPQINVIDYLLRFRSRFSVMTGRSMFSGLWFCSLIAFRIRVPWGCRCKGWVWDWFADRPISLLQASPVPGRDSHKYLRPFGEVLTRIPGMPQEYPMPLLLMFNRNGPNPIDRLKRQPMG